MAGSGRMSVDGCSANDFGGGGDRRLLVSIGVAGDGLVQLYVLAGEAGWLAVGEPCSVADAHEQVGRMRGCRLVEDPR